jgi:murein DD-endopeptidase MepM/ murein hydrolase activator NlpD
MKYKIKKFQSRFNGKVNEKLQIFIKKFGKKWDYFLQKGHEKMTIMFIPHNEKKIFNFQISKFTISFFILLFMIVLVTSSYALIRNNAIKREEKKLLLTYHDIRAQLLIFENLTISIKDQINDIKPEIEDIYEYTAGSKEKEKIWSLQDYDKETLEELRKIKNLLPDEIFTIKDIQKDIICTTNTVKTVKNFIDVRSKVVKDTPSIIPNDGHITSLFGWRRSPFGYGRDFHTGIDIAASNGTAIRATAPGVVASVGWTGGYGFSVRIKHKYGFETIYAHCSRTAVEKGASVEKGQVIAYVGQTGNATGNHCHYEIRLGNLPINPYPYMSRIW